ncbi:unnamed protein product [Amaranthus hypochondriacus]
MFYSQFILAKKGPLGTIWIAAHLERKLRKNQVADTDIGVSVDSILSPDVPIALRLSSHLLLGVVRIYSKKVNYLFDDCSEALLKVKQAFRSTAVDLPPEQSKAPYHSITLPETFDLDDFELPDNEAFQGNFVDQHVSTREQITLQDTMDSVSFPTSQFGPDERFGDGDASHIGLDLDEELLMDKGDGAGISGVLVSTDVGPETSTKEPAPSKGNELGEEVSDPPATINYFSIQAPSTPGLTEEPNLPNAKEEILVSDDHIDDHMDNHMDEDNIPSELVGKEVFGTASGPMKPSDLGDADFRSNGNFHYVDGKDNDNDRTLETESLEFNSSGFAKPDVLNEGLVATNGQNNVGATIPNSSPLDSEQIIDVHECANYAGFNKTDLNGMHHPLINISEDNNKLDGPAMLGNFEAATHDSELKNSFQPGLNLEDAETFESNVEKSSDFATPVLRVCDSKIPYIDGADNLFNSSNFPAQDDGSSYATFGKEGATNATDEVEPMSKEDQAAHVVTCGSDRNFEGQLDNLTAEENHSEKETSLQHSDFPPPEMLLSMPNLPAGPSNNFLAESTPGEQAFTKNDDATDENLISGRKRSFTESTLTVQSFNSIESYGGAQSKGTVESIPDDNDLLSSILVGIKSTGLKLKPTPPPAPDTVRTKRQRTATRSVSHKRKVLVDDSTVLHGDTIRQQLTNTEDIRRVRKKAPCTHLEVWVLQKQFLEDELFSEPVFTGMCSAFRLLDDDEFDLSGIRILRDDRNKGTSEADISMRPPSLVEEPEAVGTVEQIRPNLNDKNDAMGTIVSSTAGDEVLQGSGGSLLETPCDRESALLMDGSSLLKEMQAGDNEIMKEMLNFDREMAGLEFDSMRTPVCGDAIPSVASGADRVSCPDSISEVNSSEYNKVDTLSVEKSNDVATAMHVNVSGQLHTVEDVSGSCVREFEIDNGVSEKAIIDERSNGEYISEKQDSLDINLVTGQDSFSSPVHDFRISESVALDERAGPTLDQAENCRDVELGIANNDRTHDLGIIDDDCRLTSDNVGEYMRLDSSVETELSSQKTTLNEGEGLPFCDDDAKVGMDSTSILPEFNYIGNNAEFGVDAIEHDTDFLNVDDDDVVEDYESDVLDTEEKRILDNSGWSSRTRAVANYLQVLFEKESDQSKKVVSLDNLLVGKTRKEASRMFFETLVLKTKDYIQAEQESSFGDVQIKPRGKLLNSSV